MARLILQTAITVNGAFDSPAPVQWLELDNDSGDAILDQLLLADALVLGRRTYEGLAVVCRSWSTTPTSAAMPTG
jgi:dihydrofolate reductase